ncbi:MAG: ChaN family lipoprotein, partial [Vicinamibacterales bacterium]
MAVLFATALGQTVAGGQVAEGPGSASPQVTSGQAEAARPVTPAVPTPSYVPQRVYDTRRNAFVDFEVMLADLAGADVVFVGEQHDDPNTHRLELALLEGMHRRGVPMVVSLEMFERDVQAALDRYLAGALAEKEFLTEARPWPRYATDYRAIIELAKAHGWPVVAANVPRRFASEVAKSGKDALARLEPDDRAMAAKDLLCPPDAYFERFAKAMGDHAAGGTNEPDSDKARPDSDRTDRYYWSQCVKDETMAESIAAAVEVRTDSRSVIVHVNGAFHSDFGLGTAERVRRRLPGRRVAVVTILPVANLDTLSPGGEDLTRAEYLVFTVK